MAETTLGELLGALGAARADGCGPLRGRHLTQRRPQHCTPFVAPRKRPKLVDFASSHHLVFELDVIGSNGLIAADKYVFIEIE
jgi:hypothetical protein